MQYNCEICGGPYKAKPSQERKYCSRACYYKSEITAIPSSDVLKLYRSGLSVEKVAAFFGVSGTAVKNNLKASGCKIRPIGNHDQRGDKNPCWRGEKAGYKALHGRVRAMFGKPSRCDICGTTVAKRFDWANLTGKYDDPSDYKRMCKTCHCKYDETVKNFRHAPKSQKRDWESFEAIRKMRNESRK